MNRQIAIVLGGFCLVVAVAPAAWGQSTQTSQPAQPAPTQQQTQPTTVQTPASQFGSTPSPQPSSSTDKKVWTNEDIGDLRDHAPISTIGNASPRGAKQADKPEPPQKGKNAKWYVDQIQALEAKIPPLNDKIQQLQAALNGDQVNSTRQYGGVRPDDWKDQLQRLQKQRDDLQAKIATLEDQARHDGVAPNLLPQE
jgi:cytoskeletal protein RodZ